MASIRQIMKKLAAEKAVRLARELALTGHEKIPVPLVDEATNSDPTLDVEPIQQHPAETTVISSDHTPNPPVNMGSQEQPFEEAGKEGPKEEENLDEGGGNDFFDPPIDHLNKDQSEEEQSVEQPLTDRRQTRKRKGVAAEKADSAQGDSTSEVSTFKRARHRFTGSTPTYWQEPGFVMPVEDEAMVKFSSDLADVPAIDGIDLLAREGTAVKPGHAIIERVAHVGYRHSLATVSSPDLLARGGLCASEV